MKLKYKDKDHSYTLGGVKIPALSNVLDFWFGEFVDYTNGAAANRGTRVHLACEYYAKGCLDWDSLKTESDNITGYIKGFEKFFIDNPDIARGKPTTELKKYIILPEGLTEDCYNMVKWTGCGMRLDLVFRKTNTIVEIKTGKPALNRFWSYSREAMQLNTQIKAMSSTNKPIESWTGYLLYISNNGEYKAIEKKFNTNIWNDYICALKGWYNKNKEN